MDGFTRRRERKKESIRRAAMELFQTFGFKKVSIKDIAQKAGVSPITIYNYFGSKDELTRDVVKTEFLNLLERFRTLTQAETPFMEKLEAIIFDKTRILEQYQGELVQTLIARDPEMRQFLNSLWQETMEKTFLDFLTEGKEDGYIDKGISDEDSLAFMGVIRAGIFANPSPLNKGYNIKGLIPLILYGLMGKQKRLTSAKSEPNQ